MTITKRLPASQVVGPPAVPGTPGIPRAAGSAGPRLRTADGIELATRCWLSSEPARAAVVVAHGLTASKDDGRVVALAASLRDRGFDVIAHDSRGHGESGGECTLGGLERHDVTAVLEWARTRSTRVVLVGASMGAVAVLSCAAEVPDLVGVVAVSSPADWRLPLRVRSMVTASLARTRLGRSIAHRQMKVRIAPWGSPEPAHALLPRVRCPVVVVHGQRDPIIPPEVGLASVVTEGPQRTVVLVPEMGHAFDPIGHDRICAAADSLLRQDVARQAFRSHGSAH